MADSAQEPTQTEQPPTETDQMASENTDLRVGHLAQLANTYMVPYSMGTLQQLADEKGSVTPEKAQAFEENLKQQASGLYPTLAGSIKAGIPTAHLLEPYRQVAKKTLGDHVEPDFLGDPKWQQALTGGTDPKTQGPAPMGLAEWQNHMKRDQKYGYQHTPQANAQVGELLHNMAQAFGLWGK